MSPPSLKSVNFNYFSSDDLLKYPEASRWHQVALSVELLDEKCFCVVNFPLFNNF